LLEQILDLAGNPERRGEIGRNAAKAGRPDATSRLADQLLELANKRRQK
jgi:UDP-N-acetylglucosamine:LPS N-acetylglucosamine transferase